MKDREAQLLIVELSTAEDTIKRDAIRVFVDSFNELYTSLSKEKSVLNEFFISSFDEKLVYAAVKENKVLGILAIANGKERSLKQNTVAKRLYEYVGFKEYAREHGLITRLLGFRSIIRMKKRVK